MSLFALGIADGSATVSQLLANLAWTIPGNLTGGGLLIGLGYAWLGNPRPARTAAALAPATTSPTADLAAIDALALIPADT